MDHLVARTLAPLVQSKTPAEVAGLKIVDPACGDGAFLLGAYRYLLAWHQSWYAKQAGSNGVHQRSKAAADRGQLTLRQRTRIARNSLFGVDVDSEAVDKCQRTLRDAIHGGSGSGPRERSTILAKNILCGDALVGSDFHHGPCDSRRPLPAFSWRDAFPDVLVNGGFDAVLGNPPFVNIRLLSRQLGPAIKAYFRQHYSCARGNYDLYVLFVELAGRLLRSGGRCGLVLPNKFTTLSYARTCRSQLLKSATLERITDVSDLRLFADANVYPYLLVWRNEAPAADHLIEFVQAKSRVDITSAGTRSVERVPQIKLKAEPGFALHGELDIESRVPTKPLADCCTLHSGATGFSAHKVSEALQEKSRVGQREYWDFIVSGSIDRYRIELGDVRFMQRRYEQPALPREASCLTSRKRCLYSTPKIVIAGLSRRLEAAWDARGLALGVQVYAATDPRDDPRYLLAVLNSRLLSHLFRLRFQAKRLSGGFLAVNKGQLATLPIRVIAATDRTGRETREKILALVDRISILHLRLAAARGPTTQRSLQRYIAAADQQIDQLVYQLYNLTSAEIASIERCLYQA